MRSSVLMVASDLQELGSERDLGSEREQALQRLRKKRDLQGHLVIYLIVNVAVWLIWAATGAGYLWPAWVTGGWGLAVLLNVWDVYGRSPITEADVEREMQRLHHGH